MVSQLKQLRFRPRPLGTAVALVFTALFTGLGVWQLNRAQEKEGLSSAFEAQRALAPLNLVTDRVDIATHQYRDATVRGAFAKDHQIYVDNVVFDGRPGYEVFTPLQLENGHGYVLVDRGWIPFERQNPKTRAGISALHIRKDAARQPHPLEILHRESPGRKTKGFRQHHHPPRAPSGATL